jgi:pyruvate/2-oxoglutarate dehydrogenase complex dihydrolipoamide acyltransferase (E2) component
MAVPRPVLLAILGLALCVTALIAVRGVGTGEEDAVAPAPIPTAPAEKAQPAEPGARGRARTRPQASQATPAKPAETASKPEAPVRKKLSKAQVAKLKSEAQVVSVAKALGQNDVVVLFFSRPGAADDTGAEQAVKKLDGMKGVQIFSPNFEDLDEYRPILAGVGVAQVPAIVIAKPGRKAQLVEGFVDRKSLRQQVEDSLR